jgi:hypothetical protein
VPLYAYALSRVYLAIDAARGWPERSSQDELDAAKEAARLALGEQAAEERGRRCGAEAAIERQRLRQRRHLIRQPPRRVGELHPVRGLGQRACLPVKAPHHQWSAVLRHADRSS